jgi:periplasmic protein TonB
MFNNLIESSSHAREYKRRGSFLLFTTGVYAVLLLLAGVASIYAYDAHLEAQTTELEILSYVPLDPVEQPVRPIVDTARTPSNTRNPTAVPTRIEQIDSTSNPNNVPDHVGTVASSVPPVRPGAVLGSVNEDPPAPSFAGQGVRTGTGNTNVVTLPDPPPLPPPAATPTPVRVVKISRVLNSEARSLPKPIYPTLAKQARVQGTVVVQVLIDETGKVVSAKAVSGHPLLLLEAQRAAMGARFSPTVIGEQPVKVSGVITYNFVMP